MVNITQTLFKYYPNWLPKPAGQHNFLRKQALFRMTYAQPGRARNCYRLAKRCLVRHLQIDQEESKKRSQYFRDLQSQRIYAACEDIGYPYKYFIGKLPKMGIELDRKSLSNIAIWEPRTFKSLVEIAKKFDEKDFELK